MNLTSSCDTKTLIISGSKKAVIKYFVMKHFVMTHNTNNLPRIFNPSTI